LACEWHLVHAGRSRDGIHRRRTNEGERVTDRRSDIIESLRQRVLSGLHLGTLAPGARLPSTRELSGEFGVTPRTVMAAYRALEGEGLVEVRERSGIYVMAGRPVEGVMLSQLAGWVVDVLLDARAREIRPIEFPERVRRCLETLRLRAVCVAGNRDQLYQLCHELAEDYGIESDGFEPEALDADQARAALTRADLLVSTSLDATRVRRVAEQWRKPMVVTRLRPDIMAGVTRRLANGPVYFVATDPRFAEALHTVFAPTGHERNLRLLIVDRDDVAAIPEGAELFLMRSVREHAGAATLLRRGITFTRVFSTETARQLLTMIVRANMAALGMRASLSSSPP
jgi:DNA-binding transcriptional regulator YhcF (GntR family)